MGKRKLKKDKSHYRRSKNDVEIIADIKIESGIQPPPVNMSSPWTHLAFNMKVGDSVELTNACHVHKLRYALMRLGFCHIRRKFSDTHFRVWKVTRAHLKKKKIPKHILYSVRNQTIIGGSK